MDNNDNHVVQETADFIRMGFIRGSSNHRFGQQIQNTMTNHQRVCPGLA
jgi:hypothetical protein